MLDRYDERVRERDSGHQGVHSGTLEGPWMCRTPVTANLSSVSMSIYR